MDFLKRLFSIQITYKNSAAGSGLRFFFGAAAAGRLVTKDAP